MRKLALAFCMLTGLATSAAAGPTFDAVKAKGFVQCGVNGAVPGFSSPDSQGNWTGIDVDLCRGIAAAMFAHTVSATRSGLDTMSAFIHAIPSIALAPLFIVFLGRENTPAALAALSTFFVMYVTTTSSFASSRPEWIDLMRVLGASRFDRLRMLDIPAAIPIIVGGMRLAAPSSLIGVIIGEWFGASRGVGVLIINAMQNFQIPLLWSAVVLAVIVSLSLFALFGLLQKYAERRFR